MPPTKRTSRELGEMEAHQRASKRAMKNKNNEKENEQERTGVDESQNSFVPVAENRAGNFDRACSACRSLI